MALRCTRKPALRRFLALSFRIGDRESGYLVGPALVSTSDYIWFHFCDEPSGVLLGEDDYEVLKVYRLGLAYEDVARQFASDFPQGTTGPRRTAGWTAQDGTFYSAEGWAAVSQHPALCI